MFFMRSSELLGTQNYMDITWTLKSIDMTNKAQLNFNVNDRSTAQQRELRI